MGHTTARAAAGAELGARASLGAELHAALHQRGHWQVTAYRPGWRTQVLRACYRLARVPVLARALAARLRAWGEHLAAPNQRWADEIHNIVVNAGLNYILDAGLSGGTPITTWYLGLTDGTPTVAAGDTSASHAGWVEVTAYDEANRLTWTDGGVSSQSVSNSGSPAVFTISTNSTDVGGAFLISNSTKGGSTGTLYAAGAFSAGDKSLDDGDTLTVTATFTGAAA
jgi:hypothetical protein